ncbi:MAG TPA: tRNA (adenosine(37)-N6)-threonylcarbamoyltransferase complex dimerization subunit type 1 TsaB [Tepidisphaeraceae bacterium]|jgi:tRNA threonylcarbamoyladenosine biosynthesis protein TsaB
MCRALAIETSGRTGSIALVDDERVMVEDEFPHGLQHAAEMIPRIDRLCHDRGWSPQDIEELYVSAGPGSFTGLRIGITLAKTLAFATGARIVAVPSIRVLAHNAPPEANELIIVLDAKRNQIFTARLLRAEQGWIEAEPAHLDDLGSMLVRAGRPVHLLGDGIPHHQKFIPPGDPGIVLTPPETWRPRAAAVASEGVRLSAAGAFTDPDRLTPIYIRKPEAEEKWEQGRR